MRDLNARNAYQRFLARGDGFEETVRAACELIVTLGLSHDEEKAFILAALLEEKEAGLDPENYELLQEWAVWQLNAARKRVIRIKGTSGGRRMRDAKFQAELNEFARRLREHRVAVGWSQSDLARAVWGETTTRLGRTVAANRDRITVYEQGKSWPDPHNLKKIAAALYVMPEDLAPNLF